MLIDFKSIKLKDPSKSNICKLWISSTHTQWSEGTKIHYMSKIVNHYLGKQLRSRSF